MSGGGGGGPSTTTGTTYSSNLPEYAKPYYEELLKQTGKEVYKTDASGKAIGVKEFTPYGGERLRFGCCKRNYCCGLRRCDLFGNGCGRILGSLTSFKASSES